MECPHCHKEIPSKVCPECRGTTPVEGEYCMQCGAYVEDSPLGDDSDEGYGFEDRVLCSDGICTGIMVDGKCSECGKPSNKNA